MTSTATDAPRGAAAAPKTGTGRLIGALVALVIGSLLASAAVSLLVAGGTAVWAAGQAGPDGYFQTPAVTVDTTTYALVSPPIDLSGDRGSNGGGNTDWEGLSSNGSMSFNLGSVRLSAESADAGTPLFIGAAPSEEVSAYLADVSHAVVTQANPAPAGTRLSVISGSSTPTEPGSEDFWTLSATGTGERNLVWNLRDLMIEESIPIASSYTVVVMNADASAGVNVDLRGGARSDLIAPLGWGLLIGGLALLVVAVVLLVLGTVLLARRPARRPTAGPGTVTADSVRL
ncbi:MAG: hypothetical protein R6W83_03065 [Cryobacterium sp.]